MVAPFTNSNDPSRSISRWCRALLFSLPLSLLAAGLLYSVGCQKGEEAKSSATAVPHSAVEVASSTDGITIHSSAATFLLSSTGQLTASLRQGGDTASLDTKTLESGQLITISKKELAGVELDTEHARIRDAMGKLGPLGKQSKFPAKFPVPSWKKFSLWRSTTIFPISPFFPLPFAIAASPKFCSIPSRFSAIGSLPRNPPTVRCGLSKAPA